MASRTEFSIINGPGELDLLYAVLRRCKRRFNIVKKGAFEAMPFFLSFDETTFYPAKRMIKAVLDDGHGQEYHVEYNYFTREGTGWYERKKEVA